MRSLLITDSPDPSGVGEHMLALAGALPPGMASLAFPDHPAGRALAGRARAIGLAALTHDPDEVAAVIAASPAEIVHVHAGIGWEGLALVHAAADAGRRVLRTEHLPWLLTDPGQIRAYRQMAARLDGVIAVSRAGAAGWRQALAPLGDTAPPLHAVPNGIADRKSVV